MARLVYVVGDSGTGKSTSLRNLNPEETVVINSDAKDLPFKGFRKVYNEENENYLVTSNPKIISKLLEEVNSKEKVKHVIIDTWTRTMTDYVMSKEFRAETGFDKWSDFAAYQYDLINQINNELKDDLVVYMFAHPESYYNEKGLVAQRIAVQGQQLKRFNPESFSTTVLYTEVRTVPGKIPEFYFRTQNNGADSCKTPMGMFEKQLVENDLVTVEEKIREYYD